MATELIKGGDETILANQGVDFWNRDRREVHGGKGVVYFELSGVVT